MRVVGGACKGRRLVSFKGRDIRPTSDKVREAVFNILTAGSPWRFAAVLDLFAGTGAMGIEALSRGSKAAFFIDGDQASIAVVRKNLAGCGLEDSARVLRKDALSAIRHLSGTGQRFDLVFIDPPYGTTLAPDTLKAVEQEGLLNPEGVAVVETSVRAPLEEGATGFSLAVHRRYGDTLVYVFIAGQRQDRLG